MKLSRVPQPQPSPQILFGTVFRTIKDAVRFFDLGLGEANKWTL